MCMTDSCLKVWASLYWLNVTTETNYVSHIITSLFETARRDLKKSSVFWVSVRTISRLFNGWCWRRMKASMKEKRMWGGYRERGQERGGGGVLVKGAVAVSPAPPPDRWRNGSLGPWWVHSSAGRARWPASGSPHPDSAPPLSGLHRESEGEKTTTCLFI